VSPGRGFFGLFGSWLWFVPLSGDFSMPGSVWALGGVMTLPSGFVLGGVMTPPLVCA
jgi:hypothetical protein